jgi:hypothetical protein
MYPSRPLTSSIQKAVETVYAAAVLGRTLTLAVYANGISAFWFRRRRLLNGNPMLPVVAVFWPIRKSCM